MSCFSFPLKNWTLKFRTKILKDYNLMSTFALTLSFLIMSKRIWTEREKEYQSKVSIEEIKFNKTQQCSNSKQINLSTKYSPESPPPQTYLTKKILHSSCKSSQPAVLHCSHSRSLPLRWILRIFPSLCFAVASPFFGRLPESESKNRECVRKRAVTDVQLCVSCPRSPWPTPVAPWLAKLAGDAPDWVLLFCGDSEGLREVRNTPGAMAPLPLGPPGPKGPGPAVYSWSNRLAEK